MQPLFCDPLVPADPVCHLVLLVQLLQFVHHAFQANISPRKVRASHAVPSARLVPQLNAPIVTWAIISITTSA